MALKAFTCNCIACIRRTQKKESAVDGAICRVLGEMGGTNTKWESRLAILGSLDNADLQIASCDHHISCQSNFCVSRQVVAKWSPSGLLVVY